MPEGPEVRTIAEKLRAKVRGRQLLWLELKGEGKYTTEIQTKWPQVQHLFPSVCLEILSRGKQLFFFFENGIAFISSLGLHGHWYDIKPEHRTAYLEGTKESPQGKFHPRFGLNFGKRVKQFDISEKEIWYDDQVCFGNFTITDWNGAKEKMLTFGPDLLSITTPFKEIHTVIAGILPKEFFEKATVERFAAELRAPRRGAIQICKFLMEQKYFSGIGNYLKSEILYRARISPFRAINTLTNLEIQTLFSVALATIAESYKCGGLTHGTFLDPDMQKGTFPVFVYNRNGEKDQNGHLIRYVEKGSSPDGRGTYYVPEVQI